MQYRTFGKTGEQVSALGFGAMRLPVDKGIVNEEKSVEMIHRAIDEGINYFDTGAIYCDGQSEKTLGAAVKGFDRSNLLLSTKYPAGNPSASELRAKFENSLREMDEAYIDFYHFWGISWKFFTDKLENGPLQEALKLRDEGLIRHFSFSFHAEPEDLFKLVDTGVFESVLVQYNLLDRKNEAGIAHAAAKGLGVAIMGPVGGGRLGGSSKVFNQILGRQAFVSTPALSLRFVLANPNVHMALSGMSTLEQLLENIETVNLPTTLSDEESAQVAQSLNENRKLADLYCTGCKYCMPCPHDVNIPHVLEHMNYHRVYDLPQAARNGYRELTEGTPWLEGKNASFCTECGECEEKCPQKIPIIQSLKDAHALLGK